MWSAARPWGTTDTYEQCRCAAAAWTVAGVRLGTTLPGTGPVSGKVDGLVGRAPAVQRQHLPGDFGAVSGHKLG
jgi:hypothetical protein